MGAQLISDVMVKLVRDGVEKDSGVAQLVTEVVVQLVGGCDDSVS
jgi:hypothetical protein